MQLLLQSLCVCLHMCLYTSAPAAVALRLHICLNIITSELRCCPFGFISVLCLQERDVPDVTDIASKVHQAADAVEAAAANLQDMLGDASAAVTQAFGGLEGRVAGLKQQLLKGEKNVEAMVDEVSCCCRPLHAAETFACCVLLCCHAS